MMPLVLLFGGLGGLIVLSKMKQKSQPTPSAPQPSQERLCVNPPAIVPIPSGFKRLSGPVSATARAQARSALSMPIGSFRTFKDDDGRTLGVLIEWHCHEPDEGATPIGWHKGATLVEAIISSGEDFEP